MAWQFLRRRSRRCGMSMQLAAGPGGPRQRQPTAATLPALPPAAQRPVPCKVGDQQVQQAAVPLCMLRRLSSIS
jgi:hypothetical protein